MDVLKSFNTRRRRFKAGQPVADDEDLSPHRRQALIGGGFLGDAAAKKKKAGKPTAAPVKPAVSDEGANE